MSSARALPAHPPLAPASSVPRVLRELLDELRAGPGAEVQLWVRSGEHWLPLYALRPGAPPHPDASAVEITAGDFVGMVEVHAGDATEARRASVLLAGSVRYLLRRGFEIDSIGQELTERYEEITLLYTISEIFGSMISLEDAARRILQEVAGTLGVRRATLWVHEPDEELLQLVATVGEDGQTGPIAVADGFSVTAEVFRERRSIILQPEETFPRAEYEAVVPRREFFLAVPVTYTPPDAESRTIGVINLIGRSSEEPFTAGDLKLISAIATQIGAAVENSRLVEASLRRERLDRELELAHDLQLKLLPSPEQFGDYADVAARCVPADSVGGDFYHLFRLAGGRLGVMIGDVSSHGFGAALIMALTMSAVAIHASEGHHPAEVLGRVHRALIDELETTEMYLTLFYGVIDPAAGRITYANAGHPHAFRVPYGGEPQRLGATNPPLGIVDLDDYGEATAPWTPGEDLLLLFTDGLSDPLEAEEHSGEELLLREVQSHREQSLAELLARLFELRADDDAPAPTDDRTALLLRA